MPENITPETIEVSTEDYGSQIPEYAILRLAGFFLSKMQEEAEQKEFLEEMIAPNLYSMFVTPKDVDETVKYLSFTISEGLNIAFSEI